MPAPAQAQAAEQNALPAPGNPSGPAPETAPTPTSANFDNIDFSADSIDYDFESDVVTANGNVIVRRDGYALRAEQVIWNRRSGQVEALGKVQTRDTAGNIAYGDRLRVTDSLRDGVVDNLLLVLNEGGRLAAKAGKRQADGTYELESAAYTGCAVIDDNGCPKAPSWQVKAIKVRYDPERERVSYDGARIELFGLPVVPLPGLSHPVGDKNRSGLLVPDLRFNSANGAEFALPYYLRISPNSDLRLTGHVYTGVLPMVSATYRQLDQNGAFSVSGYATVSQPIPKGLAEAPPGTGDSFRGYFETYGRYHLADNWSLSLAGRITTDRTFLRRYDISDDDRLRSTISAERIDRNSLLTIDGWAFQTLRLNDPQNQVPVVLPRIDYRLRLSDPLIGGKVQLQLNSLAIGRAEGQDTQRAFASAQWDLRRITPLGQEITLTALARGDVYNSDDNLLNPALLNRGESGVQFRGIAAAAIDVKWPFVGAALGGIQSFTPRLQLVATPALSNLAIPNEDSRAVDLDDVNLFALNRFPGYDRYEDGVRATYGLEWQLTRPGWRVNATLGQSYRLTDNSDIVPDGTGLSERFSDIVGRTEVRFQDFVKFNFRFRLDKDNLAVRRSEIDATVGSDSTYVTASYLRLNRDIDTLFEDLSDREELRLGGRVQIDRYWSAFGSVIVDLTDTQEDPLTLADGFSPIRHRLGVAYDDGCLSLGLTWRFDYEETGDAQRGTSVLLRIALNNLGFHNRRR